MLIQHIRPRLRPAGNAILRVRRGHPLAGGLVACVVTGGQYGLGRDLITGADFTGTNSPTISLGPEGPAADFSSTAYAEAPHDASWNVLGHITVLWRGVIRTPSVLGYFVGKVPSGGAGATNTPYSFEYNNGATAGPTWIRSNATGGDPYKLWKGPANSIIADTPQTIAVSTDDTITTTPSIYIDGALVTTTFVYGFGGGAPTGNTDPLRLARRQDGAEQQNGLTSLVMIAAAQWDAGQHALANLSPYGVLEEAPRYYFATPAAGGTVWNETISESLTAAESFAGTLMAPVTLADALTGADAVTVALTGAAALADALTGADSHAATMAAVAALAESAAAGEALSPAMTAGVALSDAGTLADSLSPAATFGLSLADDLTAADALTIAAVMAAALAESVAGAESFAAVLLASTSLTDAATLADAYALAIPGTPAPASRTVTWRAHDRLATWAAETRTVTWRAHDRTAKWQE